MDEKRTVFDLDMVGVLEGTDKCSSIAYAWDYLRHYQILFAPWKDQPINLVEIGVERGFSLKVWSEYFSRARIIGIDVDPNCKRFAADRIEVEIGSQEDPGFLHNVCAKYPPTIVIDDGSHIAHQLVYTFKHAFPMLQPGGLYVIEDMEFHSERHSGLRAGNKSVSPPDYFLDLARTCMLMTTPDATIWGDDKYILDHIDCVSMYRGAVVIRKKPHRDILSTIGFGNQYLATHDPAPVHYFRLAEYIFKHNGPLSEAERALSQAAKFGDQHFDSYRWLFHIRMRQGRLDEAADAAVEATRMRPNDPEPWFWLAQAQKQRGRIDEAIAALENANSANSEVWYVHDQLSDLQLQQGNRDLALFSAKRAAQLYPVERMHLRVTELERQIS